MSPWRRRKHQRIEAHYMALLRRAAVSAWEARREHEAEEQSRPASPREEAP